MKPLIIAGVLLVGMMIGCVASLSVEAQSPRPVAPVLTTSTNGRFQIVMSPTFRADKFLIDTQTGRVWMPRSFEDYEGNPTAWELEIRIDNYADLQNFKRSLTLNPAAPTR